MDPDIYGLNSLPATHTPDEPPPEPPCAPACHPPDREQLTIDKLYRNAHHQLFLRLRQNGYSPHDAEDLVHEAFVLALTNLSDRSRDAGAFKWLRTVAHFKGKNLRKGQRRREQLLYLHSQRPITAKIPEDPQTLCRARELREAIDACPQGDYFFSAKVLGLTSHEIADLLDIPRGTAATRIRRGGRQLAAYAAEHGIDLPELLSDHQDPRTPARRQHGNVIPLFPLAAAGAGSVASGVDHTTPRPSPTPPGTGGPAQFRWLWASGLAAMGLVAGVVSMRSPEPVLAVMPPKIVVVEPATADSLNAADQPTSIDWSTFPIPDAPTVTEHSAKPRRHEPAAGPGDLAAELRSLGRLRRLIRVDGELSQARLHLTSHNEQFPNQQLESTRMLLSLELDCRLGAHRRARARAREIVRRWPSDQVFSDRIFRRFCKA